MEKTTWAFSECEHIFLSHLVPIIFLSQPSSCGSLQLATSRIAIASRSSLWESAL